MSLWTIVIQFLTFLCLFILTLVKIAYSTLAERVFMAASHRRLGPNVVGIGGVLQPFADGGKLLTKEPIIPKKAQAFLFLGAPVLVLVLNLSNWVMFVITPYQEVDTSTTLLTILVFNIIEIYGIMFAGWASNSLYALLGSVRSSAQMISYEISLGFVFLGLVFLTGSLNVSDWLFWQLDTIFFSYLALFMLIYSISILAETNRAPFDLPEAEAEIVAGYNVEYSGFLFALFFLGEYSNMLFLSYFLVLLFFGLSLSFIFVFLIQYAWLLSTICTFFFFWMVWVRATLPRYRYDQLMDLGWKVFVPSTFVLLFLLLSEEIVGSFLPFL